MGRRGEKKWQMRGSGWSLNGEKMGGRSLVVNVSMNSKVKDCLIGAALLEIRCGHSHDFLDP